MSLSSTVNRTSTAGNDVTTAFSFPYLFLADGDLVVILTVDATGVETVQTITTHYTVAGAGEQAGGTVTMITEPATGETLVIYRDPAQTQGLDLIENDPAPAESMEQAWDRSAMFAQRLSERVDRSVVLTDGFVGTFDTELPTDVNTADNMLAVNAAGTGWEMKTADDILNLTGALAIANNLSDLGSVVTALINLGIDPLSQPETTAITNGMSATSITGYSFTPGLWVKVEFFVTRNSAGTLGMGTIHIHYDGAAWQIFEGPFDFKTGKTFDHGLTFTMSTNQLQVASDSRGTGSLITKFHKAG